MTSFLSPEDVRQLCSPRATNCGEAKRVKAAEYFVPWLFSFLVLKRDKNTGWNRILNVNPGADTGFYILQGSNWYPSGRGTPASPTFPPNEWHSVTISTGPDQHAAAYYDGGSKAEWSPHTQWSDSCRIVTSSLDVMMFFNDGSSVNTCLSGGEHTGMRVKTIEVFNERLTEAQVAQLEVDNPVFAAL